MPGLITVVYLQSLLAQATECHLRTLKQVLSLTRNFIFMKLLYFTFRCLSQYRTDNEITRHREPLCATH